MARIQNGIDGKFIGKTANRSDGIPGKLMSVGGFMGGDHGNQIDLPSPSMIAHTDDFEGAALSTRWVARLGSDGAAAAAILSGGIGGVLRLTTGAAGTGLAADQVELVQALQYKAGNGNLIFQCRAKMSAITTCWAFLGFTDLAATLEGPIISAASGDTFTTNASDAVGFMFDTRMSTDAWWLTGVAADVDAAMVLARDYAGAVIAPVAAQYATYRVAVDALGTATYYINGREVGRVALTLTPGTSLTPVFSVSKTSVAASMTMDFDYAHVAMARALDGGAT